MAGPTVTTVTASGTEDTDEANLTAALQVSITDGGIIEIDGMLLINDEESIDSLTESVNSFVIRGKYPRGCGFKMGPSGKLFVTTTDPTFNSSSYSIAAGATYVRLPKTVTIERGDVIILRSLDSIPGARHFGVQVPLTEHRVYEVEDGGTYYDVLIDRRVPFAMSTSVQYAIRDGSTAGNICGFAMEDLTFERQSATDPSPRASSDSAAVLDVQGYGYTCNGLRLIGCGGAIARGIDGTWNDLEILTTDEDNDDSKYAVIVGYNAHNLKFVNSHIRTARSSAFTTAGAASGSGGQWPNTGPASGATQGRGGCPNFSVIGGTIHGRYNQQLDTHPEGYNCTFDGVTVYLNANSNTAVSGKGGQSRSYWSTYRNCKFLGGSSPTTSEALGVDSLGRYTLIEGCLFENLGDGVLVYNRYGSGTDAVNTGTTIRGCTFRNVKRWPIYVYALEGGVTASDGLVIEDNRFESGCAASGSHALIGLGTGQGTGHRILRNYMAKTDNTYSINLADRTASHVAIEANNFGGYTSNLGFTGTNAATVATAIHGDNYTLIR